MQGVNHGSQNESTDWTPVLLNLPNGVVLGLSQQAEWVLSNNLQVQPLQLCNAVALLPLLEERRHQLERRLKRALQLQKHSARAVNSLTSMLIECSLSPGNAPVWAPKGMSWIKGEERQASIRNLLTAIIYDSIHFSVSLRQQAFQLLKQGIKRQRLSPLIQPQSR